MLRPPIHLQMLALLKSSAPYVRTEAGWRTVGHILHLCSGAGGRGKSGGGACGWKHTQAAL
jgi:hypothetical protein